MFLSDAKNIFSMQTSIIGNAFLKVNFNFLGKKLFGHGFLLSTLTVTDGPLRTDKKITLKFMFKISLVTNLITTPAHNSFVCKNF